jgi:uncharacterized OB-fold protein
MEAFPMADDHTGTFIVDGWMADGPNGRIVLNGRRCARCGVCGWPPTSHCKACGGAELSEVTLGPEAELHSVTVDRMGAFTGRPHLVGQVRFAEGPFVQGFVDGDIDAPPPIGVAVEMTPFVVESGGEQLITYAFKQKEG